MKSKGLQYTTILRDELHTVRTIMLEIQHHLPPVIAPALIALIHSGGKRLRPALTLLSAYMFGGDIQAAIPLAAAIEMLHTATLIHDDLIDNAALRRGTPTLNATWTPAATVLSGDVAFAWAAQLATRSQNLRLVQRFAETLAIICNGELRQMFADHTQLPDETAYYERIFAKTASLFALATESGALLAHRPEADVQRMNTFGKLLGEAFQIVDDVLDFMGDETALGKPVGTDLRQGILTLPVLRYGQQHPEDTRILAMLSSHPDEALVHALAADLRRSDAAEWAMHEADKRAAAARALLAVYPETPYRQAMEEIAAFAVQRQY
ncbi:MAG TPA: polyprenyl synthetase family protein [Anaerolineae bacterium]|nr:polyprenyl synthetase family protein [Anaerolineae bacterium]HQK12913.1 polyprenyl synthetase family protein [Anaerolineae bacterium]